MNLRHLLLSLFAGLIMLNSGCRSRPPIRQADFVDLDRFMGDWYVVANVPTFFERNAWNALETYEMLDDGRIQTTFTFTRGGPDGPERTYNPLGFVREEDPSNALWGMQFIWPIKAEYIVMYVDEDYQETIIGRTKRDYLWIMTRSQHIPEQRLDELIQIAVDEGYDREDIQRVSHSPPEH